MKKQEIDLSTFAGRVKDIRKRLGLTQKQFAEKLNISHQAVSDTEKGSSRPGFEFFLNISKKYNVNLEYLLHGEGEPFKNKAAEIFADVEDNEEMREFFRYFFNSKLAQHRVLSDFRRLLLTDLKLVEIDVKETLKKG